jgi:hypothetical protein
MSTSTVASDTDQRRNEHYNDDLIHFKTMGFGVFRLSAKFVSHSILSRLAATSALVLIDSDGNEHIPDERGLYPELQPGQLYTVCDEADLDAPVDEHEFAALSPEQQRQLMESSAVRAVQMEHARREVIAELYRPLHANLYRFDEAFLLPSFVDTIKRKQFDRIVKKETETGVYSLVG